MHFTNLGLSEPITRAVKAEGYTVPTPIQQQAIPPILSGRDVLGCAQTGTGKTAAFALPILHRLSHSHPAAHHHGHAHHGQHRQPVRKVRALILSPTRELTAQIADSFRAYGRNVHLTHTTIYGGVSQNPQTRALREGVDIVVATPGRLLDLMNQGYVDLSGIEVFVLDEADRMLDMGFIHDIRKVVAKLPAHRQTLFFSATMPGDIRRLADAILKNPVSIQVAALSLAADHIEQTVYFVDKPNKPQLLTHLLKHTSIKRALVFTRTKHGADRVARGLFRAGIQAQAIHGNKSQNARQRSMDDFKAGKTHVLIATDIAARGIDVDDISHVINYDLPNVPETYVHRIGRTARAGASGVAISLCDREERGLLKDIERLTRLPIQVRTDQPVYHAPERHDSQHSHGHAHTVHAPHAGHANAGHSGSHQGNRQRRRRSGRSSSSGHHRSHGG